jgi:hypothetical protein
MDNKSIDSLPEDVRHIISETVARQTTSTINLCQTQNICHYLKQNLQLCGNSLSKHCVGYLESPKKYRHVFYLQKRRLETNSKQNQRKEGSLFSIFDLMAQKVEDALTIVDQLKLAHKAALAMLQFNDTPWLSPRWRLADVSYFGSGGVFNEDSLKTLHLSSQLAPRQQRLTSDMEGIEAIKPLFSEEEYFGIENPTLFSLGVALLEIAHWQPLESLSTLPYPNEYVAARRLASRPTPLGPKYQEIARKCLQCNFGFGTDLKKKELQAGVYGDVVCQLEKMIETLSI